MNLNELFQESPSEPFGEDLFDYMSEVESYAEREYRTELSFLMHQHGLTLADFNKKFIERVSPYKLVDDLMFEENSHKSKAYVASLL